MVNSPSIRPAISLGGGVAFALGASMALGSYFYPISINLRLQAKTRDSFHSWRFSGIAD